MTNIVDLINRQEELRQELITLKHLMKELKSYNGKGERMIKVIRELSTVKDLNVDYDLMLKGYFLPRIEIVNYEYERITQKLNAINLLLEEGI